MGKALYVECNAGIAGDMAVAALLDLGASREVLLGVLRTIPVTGFQVEIRRVKKAGIDCMDFNVILDAAHENHDHDMKYLFGHDDNEGGHEHEHHHGDEQDHEHEHEHGHDHEHEHHHGHRNMDDVLSIIDKTAMSDVARSLAHKIFQIIAEAESKAHGIPLRDVHFHEVGAIDSIVDVIALAVLFDDLRTAQSIDRVYVPYLCEGTGTIRCQHGILPIPVPAVSNIVREYGIPLKIVDDWGEFVTPTGAAFVAAVATDFAAPKECVIKKTGMGAGKRSYKRTNIVRANIIEENDSSDSSGASLDTDREENSLWKLETNIDDCTGEALGFVMERLFEAGARDVAYIPCFMKKNRPAYLLAVICKESDIAVLESVIFTHTTTIGIRRVKIERTALPRTERNQATEYGPVRIKEVLLPDGTKRGYPEYEDLARVARETGKPIQELYQQFLMR